MESASPSHSAQSGSTLDNDLAKVVEEYRLSGDIGTLIDQLRALASHTDPGELARAVRRYASMPEVVIPVYEHIVAERPRDAQAMVVLANAYWLTGRGTEAVGALAHRAKEADETNRGAWHLWALSESDLRRRVERWRQVAQRFPHDQLARAALADNAVSLSTSEDDPAALDLAIVTYEGLLAEATHPKQRLALETTLKALRR